MDAIRIEGLTKSYGGVRALDGLDLSVTPGTVFGFLGPNGAGKTTTIRILTGLVRGDAGRVWVAGEDVSAGARQVAHLIGHLPEEPAFYSWMTAAEFVDHVARTFGLAGAVRSTRVGEVLELVGLSEVAHRRIGGFSRGMRQRLGLAQALVNRPQVLFLDEPTSALDPAGRREVLELIERLRGQCTVFMSTHILADVERVCDRIGIVAKGKLVTQAARETLLSRYALPVFEVQALPDQGGALAGWADSMRSSPWIETITIDASTARIVVHDTAVAMQALLPSAVGAGLVLTRYEMMRPSLEEVFLRLVDGEGHA